MSAPINADAQARHDSQVKQVRAGCSGCLVFLLLGLLFLGGFKGLEQGLRVGTLGRSTTDLMILAQPESHAKAILWIGVFTLIALVAALNTTKTARAFWRVGLVLVLGGAALKLACYTRFVALRALPGNEVALVYLWPRPDVRIDVRHGTVGEEFEAAPGDHFQGPLWSLVITVDGKTYRSEAGGTVTEARQFLRARGATPAR